MKIEATESREKILAFITSSAMADCEDAVATGLDAIMHPSSSRTAMGETFQNYLGYNPIRDYDIADIDAVVADVIQNGNSIVTKLVTANRQQLVERAMTIYEESREEQMQLCVVKAANELFGTSDAEAIAMVIGCDIAEVVDIDRPTPADGEEDDIEGFEDLSGEGSSHADDVDDDFLDLAGDDDDD